MTTTIYLQSPSIFMSPFYNLLGLCIWAYSGSTSPIITSSASTTVSSSTIRRGNTNGYSYHIKVIMFVIYRVIWILPLEISSTKEKPSPEIPTTLTRQRYRIEIVITKPSNLIINPSDLFEGAFPIELGDQID